MNHNSACPNLCAFANANRSKDADACADLDPIFNDWNSVLPSAAANRYAWANIFPNHGPIMNHYSDTAIAKLRSLSNLTLIWHDTPSESEVEFLDEPWKQGDPITIKPMSEPVQT